MMQKEVGKASCPFSGWDTEFGPKEFDSGEHGYNRGVREKATRKISSLNLPYEDREVRLTLDQLTDAIAVLIGPSEHLVCMSWLSVLREHEAAYLYPSSKTSEDNIFQPCEVNDILRLIHIASIELDIQETLLLYMTGVKFGKMCIEHYKKELACLGSSITDLMCSLEGFHEHIHTKLGDKGVELASFRAESIDECHEKGQNGTGLLLHVYFNFHNMKEFLCGVVECISKELYGEEMLSSLLQSDHEHTSYFTICLEKQALPETKTIKIHATSMEAMCVTYNPLPSRCITESKIGVLSFCQAFPFHVIFDNRMNITQVGSGMARSIAMQLISRGLHFRTYFEVLKPVTHMTFSSVLSRINCPFELRIKTLGPKSSSKQMLLKGQMVYLPECKSILFLGSPMVDGLEKLIGKGLYISDIPIHDVTRDVILVGEQTRAQDSLKKRMEQLKCKVEDATLAVDKEKQKNVELLNLVFPADVARKLWRGEEVLPKTVNDVGMLFSDIVGFTSICSTATPMQVITMLTQLYLDFDTLCGIVDVYKIETIGDAYCVASGLHRPSALFAPQIAWMALKMMEKANLHKTHSGKMLSIRIGLHCGHVLAGVVGTKMPRFCLFGNSVYIANKMESSSEANRINVSQDTSRLLGLHGGFQLLPRQIETVSVTESAIDSCSFLDSYVHKEGQSGDHILAALVEHGIYDINETKP